MKRLLFVVFCYLVVFAPPQVPAQQSDGEAFEVPAGRASWKHEETGLLMPHQLGELTLETGFRYNEPALGVQVRYLQHTLGIKADVYIYPCPVKQVTGEQVTKVLVEEMKGVLQEIRLLVKQGDYRNATFGQATARALSIGDTKVPVVQVPIQLEIVDQQDPGAPGVAVNSYALLTLYRGQFVKLRCTYARDEEAKVKPLRRTFVDQWLASISDSARCSEVNRWVNDFRASPLNAAGGKAGDRVADFAEGSPLVTLTIGESLDRLAKRCGADPAWKTRLRRALLVGATSASLQAKPRMAVVEEGIGEVRKWCESWKQEHPDFQMPALREFADSLRAENNVGPASNDDSSI